MKGKKKEYKVAEYAWKMFENTGIAAYYMFYKKLNDLK